MSSNTIRRGRAVLAVAIAFVSACSGRTPPSHWYANGPTWVVYLAWTEDSTSHLQGQVQVTSVEPSDPTQLKSTNAPFTGTVNGPDVSITFPILSSFGGETWTGTLQGDSLSLVVPTSSLPANATLRAGSFSDFQSAAAKLQQSVNSAQQRQAAYEAAAAQRQAAYNDMSSASDQLGQAYSATRRALSTLQQLLPEKPEPNSLRTQYARAWAKMQQDWAREQQAAEVQPLTCYQKGTISYIAGTVSYDLGAISYLDGESRNILQQIQSNVNVANEGVDSAQKWAPIYDQRAQNYAQLTGTSTTSGDATASSQSFAESSLQVLQTYAQRVETFEQIVSSTDDRAASLDRRAKAFPVSISCSG